MTASFQNSEQKFTKSVNFFEIPADNSVIQGNFWDGGNSRWPLFWYVSQLVDIGLLLICDKPLANYPGLAGHDALIYVLQLGCIGSHNSALAVSRWPSVMIENHNITIHIQVQHLAYHRGVAAGPVQPYRTTFRPIVPVYFFDMTP